MLINIDKLQGTISMLATQVACLSKLVKENIVVSTDGEPTDPPAEGESSLRFDFTTGIFWYWDGDSWEEISAGSSTFGTTSLSPPVDAPVGDDPVVLINLTTGVIYYWDGDSWESLAPIASDVAFTPAGNIAATDVQAALQELDTEKAALSGATFTGDIVVPAEAYGVSWNGSNEAPTKDAVYDKIEAVTATIPTVSDTAYGAGWNGDATVAPSKNAVYDQMELKANITALDNLKKDQVGITIDGGGSVITTGQKGMIRVPYSGTITGWTVLETTDTPVTGSITVDVWKDTYANYPPDVSDSIFTTKPSLSSDVKNQNLSPTFVGAGATVTEGDIIAFNVEATPSNVKRVTVLLHITKS